MSRSVALNGLDTPMPDVTACFTLQTATHAAPTVKQRFAAIRHLFDWLVTGQVVPGNPAALVRGSSNSVNTSGNCWTASISACRSA